MKPISLIFCLAPVLACGVDHEITEKEGLSNDPGGAYYASFTTGADTCKLLEPPNEALWVDVAPQGQGYYNIAFWEFYFERALITYEGWLSYETENKYFPNVYVTAAAGSIINEKIALDIIFSVYVETAETATREFLCAATFYLNGKKILDYPTL